MNPVIMIHGGAGNLNSLTSIEEKQYHESLKAILTKVSPLLEEGYTSIEIVSKAVELLENDPLYNAGKGSVLNSKANFEFDASIMDGQDLQSGAVAGINSIKNPIHLAKLVMTDSEHVMLIGDGAMEFAKSYNLPVEEKSYFSTPKRVSQFNEAKKQNKVVLDHSDNQSESLPIKGDPKKYGTVGAVALDLHGNIAAATSTGGIVNKKYGRVGDSPIIGAGTYADNDTLAVSCTGYGEQFIRTSIAKHISDLVYMKNLSLDEAMQEALEYLTQKVKGLGGMITINSKGEFQSGFTTEGMIHGVYTKKTGIKTSLTRSISSKI